jgi:hypothetical protein
MTKHIRKTIWILYCGLIFIPIVIVLFVLGGIDAVIGSSLVAGFSEFLRRIREKFLSHGHTCLSCKYLEEAVNCHFCFPKGNLIDRELSKVKNCADWEQKNQ